MVRSGSSLSCSNLTVEAPQDLVEPFLANIYIKKAGFNSLDTRMVYGNDVISVTAPTHFVSQ